MRKLLLVVVFIIFVVCGCRAATVTESGSIFVTFYTDPETGVEYVIYREDQAGGICPRYNADGSLYVEGDADETD